MGGVSGLVLGPGGVSPDAVPSPHEAADALLTEVLGSEDRWALAQDRADELTAVLLREQWMDLLAGLSGSDDLPLPGWLAWRAAYGLHHLGHLRDANAVAARVDPTSDPADLARLDAVRAAIAWNRGEHDLARTLVEEAAALDAASGGTAQGHVDVARALLSAADGDRDANLRYYERARSWAERTGDDLTLERVLNNLASRALEEGDTEAAVASAVAGQEVNLRTGHRSGLALLRHNHAEALMTLGRLDEALAAAHQARTFYASAGSPNAGASWQLVADIQATLGLATQAAASYRHAITAAEQEGDAQTLVPSLAGLALVIAPQDPVSASELIARVEREPVAVRGAVALTAAGWVHLCTGEEDRAREQARIAIEEAGRTSDFTRMAEALELLCLLDEARADDPRLREAGQLRRRIGDPVRIAVHRLVRAHLGRDALERRLAVRALQAHGVVADAGQIAGQLHAIGDRARTAPIRIHSLGAFSVMRDGEVVPAASWPSRKAHEALRLIAAHGATGLTRARLGDLLWPEARDVSNRLSVALSHLRATLDPERRHASDHFLRVEGGRLLLAGDHVEHDVEEFRRAAQTALAAAARSESEEVLVALEAAASLYTGDFADGEDAEWALDLREELSGLVRQVIRELALLHLERGAPDAAVPWLTRLLATDPFDEPDHLALIGALREAGRYGEARLAHRRYAERMAQLGVPARVWDAASA